MDRNHATGPVVDMSAIAATFPGKNLYFDAFFETSNSSVTHSYHGINPDLTSEERQLLLDIRRRKAELLQVWFWIPTTFFQCNLVQEISQLKEEITDISTEIDAMDTEEGWESFTSFV